MAWKHLQHINILPLLGATIGDNKLSLISEWMDQGNIVQYLDRVEHLEVNRIELVSCGYLVEETLTDLGSWSMSSTDCCIYTTFTWSTETSKGYATSPYCTGRL